MASPIIAGFAVAAAAYAGRLSIQAWQALKTRPPKLRKFYEGGFQTTMTKREAALILGVRWVSYAGRVDNTNYDMNHVAYVDWLMESVALDKVKEAHRRVMVANHPDAGGSHYLASKINEAKDMLTGKTRDSGSAF